MSFFAYEAVGVWFADNAVWVKLKDGSTAGLSLSNFPKLANASREQQSQFEIIDGYALYWPELDEDLSVSGFFENQEEVNTTQVFSAVI